MAEISSRARPAGLPPTYAIFPPSMAMSATKRPVERTIVPSRMMMSYMFKTCFWGYLLSTLEPASTFSAMSATMTTIICVSGPPFHSTMWAHVEKRLNTNGVNTVSWSLFGTETGTFDAELSALVSHVARVEGPVVLVGHGLANPLVIAATIAGNVSGIVLTNGPLSQPDRWTRIVHWVSKTPRPLTMAWLRSSVGLRRLVVNPYVMDRDTTVAVAGFSVAGSGKKP